MKTVILSVFAILFALTGMSQTTGTDSSSGMQNSTNQQSTTMHHPGKHYKSTMKNSRNSSANASNYGRTHRMNSSGKNSSASGTTNATSNGSKVRGSRRSANGTMHHKSSSSTNSVDTSGR